MLLPGEPFAPSAPSAPSAPFTPFELDAPIQLLAVGPVQPWVQLWSQVEHWTYPESVPSVKNTFSEKEDEASQTIHCRWLHSAQLAIHGAHSRPTVSIL